MSGFESGQIECLLNPEPSDACWPMPGPGLYFHVSSSAFGTSDNALGTGRGSVNGWRTKGLVGNASSASTPVRHTGSVKPGGQYGDTSWPIRCAARSKGDEPTSAALPHLRR